MEYMTLSNGVEMPILGYGVSRLPEDECEQDILEALDTGYRLIDTAQVYHNEDKVGAAVSKSGINREDIFLTTKVWLTNFGYERAKDSIHESMKKLQTDYIDLCLIHQCYADYYGAWRALEELYKSGRIRAIGISNFSSAAMIDLASFNEISPMVNQVLINPYHQQTEAKEYMDEYGVQAEAWSPFARGRGNLFDDPLLKIIGEKHGKTVAQIVLRWEIQRGIVTIPKSAHLERIRQNFDVFDFALDDDDMNAIKTLDCETVYFPEHNPLEIMKKFGDSPEEIREKENRAKRK